MNSKFKKTVIVLGVIFILLICGVAGALYWASKNAAVIANEIALEQKVLKGKIIVHKLDVGMLGNISFENFVWHDPEGKIVAEIPKGNVKINLRDALTGNFNSKSLESIEFDNPTINLVFNDKMELNVLDLSRIREKDTATQENKPNSKKEFNFSILLKNATLSSSYANRKFALTSTNADIKLDTASALTLDIKAGKVAGNINAQDVVLKGSIDLKPQTPLYNLTFNVGSVIPSSISSGIDIDQPLAINSKITGELPNPIINGDFAMNTLSMAPLVLDKLSGKFQYTNAILNITESQASTYDGAVQAKGTINIDSKNFNFDISGQNLSSLQVTDNKVSGPLSFDMVAKGSADANSLVANGSFYIGDGKFSGIPFKSMDGNFSRYNGKMSFSNVTIKTIAGSFTTDMLQNSLGKIQLGTMTPFFVENIVKDQLVQKGRDLVRGLFK